MLALLASLVVAQPSLKVAVLDASAPDAIYEDVSRSLAQRVSDELLKRGFLSRRVDEAEIPPRAEGCRLGPCLGIIAHSQAADVLVLVDATEDDKGRIEVTLSAMRGRDGMPLAAGKWPTTADGKPTKPLKKFLDALTKAAAQHVPPEKAP